MKFSGQFLSVAVVASLAFFSVLLSSGCEEKSEKEGAATPVKPDIYSISTGGTGGTYYPLGGAISKVSSVDNSGLQLEVSTSGGSVENANRVTSGKADFAIMQPDIANYAYFGTHFFKDKGSKKLTAVASIYPEHIQVFATKASGITSIADLKGKRVAIGDVGSGSEANALQILEAYGLTPNDFAVTERLNATQSKDAMQDGRIDAAFFTYGIGSSVLTELATNAEVTIVAISGGERDKLVGKYKFYQPSIVPAGSYKGIDADVQTVTMPALLVANADVSAEVVEQVLAAMFKHIDEIHNTREILKKFNRANAASVPIPLHPGAEKYYAENPAAE